MTKYNALVLEDTLSDQLAIEMVLDQFPEINTTYVKNSKSFLHEISKNKFQIYIMDIMLNECLTGVDLLHSITDPMAWVIISSSMDSKDYYHEFKDLQFNKFYIKKPIDEFVFRTNIESFLFSRKNLEIDNPEDNFVMLKQGNYMYKVAHEDITIIETSDHATTVHTPSNKFTTYTALKVFEDTLKNKNFERANRNTLINMDAVKRINFKENYLEIDCHKVPISRSNRQSFLEKFEEKTV
jgi:DNA-binding LytR/AlgR family response regulator